MDRIVKVKFFSISLSLLFAGCVSSMNTRLRTNANIIPKPAEKGPQNLQSEQPTISKAPSVAELHELVKRISQLKHNMTADDQETLSKVNLPTKPGSIAEAAVTVGILKHWLSLSNNKPVNEIDLRTGSQRAPNNGNLTDRMPLEQRFKTKQINFVVALQQNILLRNYNVFQIVDRVLKQKDQESDFYTAINQVLIVEAQKWQRLANIPIEANSIDENELSPISDQNSDIDASQLIESDAVIMEAERLAKKGQFKEAIVTISSITANDPFYAAARERVKIFSNKAVKNLRQNAAQAILSSRPVTDIIAKAAYLQEARNHLESALHEYPEADDLETVEENLATVKRGIAELGPLTESRNEAANNYNN